MAARRLWAALAIELCLYVALILLFLDPPSRVAALLLIPLAMLTLRAGLILISFALSESLPSAAPLEPSARMHMWVSECAAFFTFLTLIMRGPGRDRYVPDGVRSVESEKPLIILLHGLLCSGAVWRPIAAALADRTGCEVRTPSMPRITASLSTQVNDFAALLEECLNPARRRRVIVIGHSLGGLIARQAAMRYGERLGISRVICIGTPHDGSRLVRFGYSHIARDLRPRKAAALARDCSNRFDIINVHAEHDNLVIPAQSSRLCCARNIGISGCGHMALIYSREVFEILVREIALAQEATIPSSCFR